MGRGIALGILAAGIGYASFAAAMGSVYRGNDPAAALRFAPNDSGALAGMAQRVLTTPDPASAGRVSDLALRSIRAQALNPSAIAALGVAKDLRGDQAGAARLINLAQRVGQRTRLAQLWLIEYHAAHNQLPQVLVQYDLALRSSEGARDLLLPALGNALSDPEIRKAMKPYVKAGAPWLVPFLITRVAAPDQDPRVLSAMILEDGPLPRDSVYRIIEIQLVDKLAGAAAFDELERFYRSLPYADLTVLRSAAIGERDASRKFGALGWRLVSDPDAGAEFSSAANGQTGFSAYANPGHGGTAASKLLFLAPGRYRFQAKYDNIALPARARANWILRCGIGEGSRIVWQGRPVDGARSEEIDDSILIDEGCPHQFLELDVSGGEDRQGVTFDVVKIDLTRVAPR
ncbi:hypothetical protein HNP52_002860 [Sphingomonas kyeonggiensis]|uniref:Uncharacterized protein n=1 Tax=Sphingomonas kyeonggiensis TaxID=1268553 RepID=A0A7W7NTE0_9SPHN|nr:hypothetical protein [Sphingomonas kyeonggiensis]MBB4839791.1 hypothetical protein [Sphingomonas kyeonggiensis]